MVGIEKNTIHYVTTQTECHFCQSLTGLTFSTRSIALLFVHRACKWTEKVYVRQMHVSREFSLEAVTRILASKPGVRVALQASLELE